MGRPAGRPYTSAAGVGTTICGGGPSEPTSRQLWTIQQGSRATMLPAARFLLSALELLLGSLLLCPLTLSRKLPYFLFAFDFGAAGFCRSAVQA